MDGNYRLSRNLMSVSSGGELLQFHSKNALFFKCRAIICQNIITPKSIQSHANIAHVTCTKLNASGVTTWPDLSLSLSLALQNATYELANFNGKAGSSTN